MTASKETKIAVWINSYWSKKKERKEEEFVNITNINKIINQTINDQSSEQVKKLQKTNLAK